MYQLALAVYFFLVALVHATITYPETEKIRIGPDNRWAVTALAFADFDGDQRLDVAFSSYLMGSGGAIYWLRSLGDGLFETPERLVLQNQDGIALEAADMDGDDDIDLVAGNTYNKNQDAALLLLVNDGTGSFTSRTILPSERLEGPTKTLLTIAVGDVKLADFNADGLVDIIVTVHAIGATEPPEQYGGMLVYLENNGAGDFTTKVLSEETKQLATLAVADFDGNGALDVAVLSFGRSVLWVFKNDGLGNFASDMVDISAVANKAVAAGDLDGDGKPDIVCLSDPYLIRYRNNGDVDGSLDFEEDLLYDEKTVRPRAADLVLVQDVDGDNLKDIVTGPAFPYFSVHWFRQSETGMFVSDPERLDLPVMVNVFAFADINGDGIEDIVWSDKAPNYHINSILGHDSGDDGKTGPNDGLEQGDQVGQDIRSSDSGDDEDDEDLDPNNALGQGDTVGQDNRSSAAALAKPAALLIVVTTVGVLIPPTL